MQLTFRKYFVARQEFSSAVNEIWKIPYFLIRYENAVENDYESCSCQDRSSGDETARTRNSQRHATLTTASINKIQPYPHRCTLRHWLQFDVNELSGICLVDQKLLISADSALDVTLFSKIVNLNWSFESMSQYLSSNLFTQLRSSDTPRKRPFLRAVRKWRFKLLVRQR